MQREPEPTIQDVMNVIGDLSTHVDGRFDELRGELTGVKGEVTGIKGEIKGLKGEVHGMEKRLARVESLMVTKDYLDDKLADMRGDIVGLVRKEYNKTERLVGILEEDRVISTGRAAEIRSFEVFPRAPQV